MPKRGAAALLLTTAALALLLSFKTPSSDPAATGDVALAPSTSSSPAAASTPAATSGAGATADPSAEPATTPDATATPADTSTAYQDGTVTGSAVGIRWGTVQVQVTIEGGVITDVTALQLPTGDRHSLDISQRVEPVLRSSALESQSADISILSGATFTSRAYARSLQSALDSARA